MELEQLAASFETSNWPSEFADKLGAERHSKLSAQDFKKLLKHARINLEKGRVGRALNWVALGLYLDPSRMVARCKRDGLFRASKYNFQGNALARILERILQLQPILDLSAKDISYLRSVRSLLSLSPAVLQIRRFILRELKRRQKVALKSLVAKVDLLFLQPRQVDYELNCSDPRYYTTEQHAEALSLLVHNFWTLNGIEDKHFRLVDESGIEKGIYDQLLIAACKLRLYQEAEIWVDVFSYSVAIDGDTFHLTPGDSRLEQSIRLGYMQTENQKNLTIQKHFNEKAESRASVQEWAKSLYATHGAKLVQLLEEPIRRYVLMLPQAPILLEPFQSDNLFREDIANLGALAKVHYTDLETVPSFQLAESLTVLELLKIQRFLDFVRGLMAERLLPLLESSPRIAVRSLVPVFEKERLLEVLKLCVSEEAANTFLQIATYDHSKGQKVFDVQYQPVIQGVKKSLLPLNILCRSDLLRNLLYIQGVKVLENRDEDPMQRSLAETLQMRFSTVAENTKLKVDGHELEIDVVAIFERRLLVVECKNAFHPCGAHELRTSYDHILKAASQLDRLTNALRKVEVRNQLIKQLSGESGEVEEILTCIVTANRLFNGYQIGDHPVRQANEMMNMIVGGVASFGEEEIRLWRDNDFQAEDLLDYLAGSTIQFELFDALEEICYRYEFGSSRMVVSSYALDVEKLVQSARQKRTC